MSRRGAANLLPTVIISHAAHHSTACSSPPWPQTPLRLSHPPTHLLYRAEPSTIQTITTATRLNDAQSQRTLTTEEGNHTSIHHLLAVQSTYITILRLAYCCPYHRDNFRSCRFFGERTHQRRIRPAHKLHVRHCQQQSGATPFRTASTGTNT